MYSTFDQIWMNFTGFSIFFVHILPAKSKQTEVEAKYFPGSYVRLTSINFVKRSWKSPNLIQKHEKSEHFGNVLSFTDSLVGFEHVWIHRSGPVFSSQSGASRAELAENKSRFGVPESQNVDRCTAYLIKNTMIIDDFEDFRAYATCRNVGLSFFCRSLDRLCDRLGR